VGSGRLGIEEWERRRKSRGDRTNKIQDLLKLPEWKVWKTWNKWTLLPPPVVLERDYTAIYTG
jgi:hypothetical protein